MGELQRTSDMWKCIQQETDSMGKIVPTKLNAQTAEKPIPPFQELEYKQ